MRFYVASILALFIVTIACVDPLYCSDGCDRGGVAATQSAQTGADCPTCLSAVVPYHGTSLNRTEITTQLFEIAAPSRISTYRTDVDHPPRLA